MGTFGFINIQGKYTMEKSYYLKNLEQGLRNAGESEDYVNRCCSYAERLLESGLPVIFDLEHLALLIGMEVDALEILLYTINTYQYKQIYLPKKSGGTRTISIPSMDLKYIQRWILRNILNRMHISVYATGFVYGQSIVTNAKKHINQACVINLDIKDFFPSVSAERIFGLFRYYGYTKKISYFLARLCTYEGVLPQGSPASPMITNIVCLKLDKRLSKLAEKFHAAYSRYADDITFSGDKGITKLIPVAKEIILQEGFQVNEKKTRILLAGERQEVTGLTVNGTTVKVSREYKRKLRQEIYYCKKYGVQNHQKQSSGERAFFKEHLYGKAYFVYMVEPLQGKKFLAELDEIEWEY